MLNDLLSVSSVSCKRMLIVGSVDEFSRWFSALFAKLNFMMKSSGNRWRPTGSFGLSCSPVTPSSAARS